MARKLKLSEGVKRLYEAGKIPASAFGKAGYIKWTSDIVKNLSPVDLSILTKGELLDIYRVNYWRINKSISTLQSMEDEHYIVPSLKVLQKKIRVYKEGVDGKAEYVGMKTVLQPFKNPDEIKSKNELTANVSRIVQFLKSGTRTKEEVKQYNKRYTEQFKSELKDILNNKTISSKEKKEVERRIDSIDVTKLSDFWRIFNRSYELKGSMAYDESNQRLEFFKNKYLTDLINGRDLSIDHLDALSKEYLNDFNQHYDSGVFDFSEDDM